MIDLTFKVLGVILFIAGIIFQFAMKESNTGTFLMIIGIFVFLQAQIISELHQIREKMEKKE